MPPPLTSTLPGCPYRSAPSALVVWGLGRRFNGASWLHGFPAVPRCGMVVVFVRCRRLLKYIKKEICMNNLLSLPPQPVRAARWQPALWICVNFEPPRGGLRRAFFRFLCVPQRTLRLVLNLFQPPFLLSLCCPPSRLRSARVPLLICSTCPCGAGAGRRFCGATWMHGYTAVPECGMEVVFVSRR